MEQTLQKPVNLLPERIVWVIALLIIAAAGFYFGQQSGIRNGLSQQAQATQQFLSQRGGGQGGQGGQGGSRGGFGQNGAAGTVDHVDGNSIVVKQSDGSSVTIQTDSSTTFRQQATAQLSDVKAGQRVTAIGTRNGTTVQATTVQIGGGFGGQGGTRQGGQGGGQGGGGQGGGGQGGAPGGGAPGVGAPGGD